MTTFNKGDKVRYRQVRGYENWAGLEGVVVSHDPVSLFADITVTKDTGRTMGTYTGQAARLLAGNLELIPATAPLAMGDKVRVNELPREVKLEEIRVGDRIRVTYDEESATYGDVTETAAGVVREGTVHSITGGNKFDSKLGYRINPYRNGHEITYELLERPAPEPVLTTATAEVGTQFRTSHGPVGKRLLTKVAEDTWSDFFLTTEAVFKANDRTAQNAFDDRGGEWLEV